METLNINKIVCNTTYSDYLIPTGPWLKFIRRHGFKNIESIKQYFKTEYDNKVWFSEKLIWLWFTDNDAKMQFMLKEF